MPELSQRNAYLGECKWADKPNASGFKDFEITITDVPIGGRSRWASSGIVWTEVGLAAALVSGGGNLAATLDGSNRLASLTNVGTGRAYTFAYSDATHLAITDNGSPQARVDMVLDGSGRLVSATGNF